MVNDLGHRNRWGFWDEIGKLQFQYLVKNGLQPEHKFLDVGCGLLRGGIHFISYLDRGNYFGIDRDEKVLETAREVELRVNSLEAKAPTLKLIEDFDFESFGTKFDYALAQSVFTHLPLNNIIRCIMNIDKILQPDGIFFATFWENPKGKFNLEPIIHDKSQPPIVTYFDKNSFHYEYEIFQQICSGTNLTVKYIGDWDHPRGQAMLKFIRT